MRPVTMREVGRLLVFAFLAGAGLVGFVLCIVASHLGAEWFASPWGLGLAMLFLGASQCGVGMAVEDLDYLVGERALVRSD
jgi:hypothetical protein